MEKYIIDINDQDVIDLINMKVRMYKESGKIESEISKLNEMINNILMTIAIVKGYDIDKLKDDTRAREFISNTLQLVGHKNTKFYNILDKKNKLDDINWYETFKCHNPSKRFEAYKRYLLSINFSESSIDELDLYSDKLMNNLVNPLVGTLDIYKTDFYRNIGLVMGEVQSGKTNVMIATLDKSIDSGYKLAILIAGNTSKLRDQLQKRVEVGLLGRDTITNEEIGIGKYLDEEDLESISIFTRRDEVNEYGKEESGELAKEGLKSLKIKEKEQTIIVCKRNHIVTERLIKWVKSQKMYDKKLKKLVGIPTIIIADECDESIINTGDSVEIAKNNKVTRKLVNMISQINYIGFTATPFANIFIDPDDDNEIIGKDLFPKDFMVYFPPGDTYIGAKEFFLEDNSPFIKLVDMQNKLARSEVKRMERSIKDARDLDELHRQQEELEKAYQEELDKSLEESIDNYLLIGALRSLRGYGFKHNSMLVHVDRKTISHKQIKEFVNNYLYKLREKIKAHDIESFKYSIFKLFEEIKKKSKKVKELDKKKNLSYSYNLNFTETEIYNAVIEYLFDTDSNNEFKIKVREINSTLDGEKLDYENYTKEGLHVIAIGGQVLSRGITLEGLTVSYLFRESATIDSLLQNCRFFCHYSPDYRDLVTLYTTEKIKEFMTAASKTTYSLIDSVIEMSNNGATPEEYALYMDLVRAVFKEKKIVKEKKSRLQPATFNVEDKIVSKIIYPTNKSKRKNSVKSEVDGIADGIFDGHMFEMATFYKDGDEINTKNLEVLDKLISKLQSGKTNFEIEDDNMIWKDVDVSLASYFIENMIIPKESRMLSIKKEKKVIDKKDIITSISNAIEEKKIKTLDIVLFNNNKKRDLKSSGQKFTALEDYIYPVNRKTSIKDATDTTYVTAYGKSTNTRDLQYSLERLEKEEIERKSKRSFNDTYPPQEEYVKSFRNVEKSALLLIYLQNSRIISESGMENQILDKPVNVNPISFSFYYPGIKKTKTVLGGKVYLKRLEEARKKIEEIELI